MTNQKECREWVCEYCEVNNHEACLIFELERHYGIIKCMCICNIEVKIPQ